MADTHVSSVFADTRVGVLSVRIAIIYTALYYCCFGFFGYTYS